MNNQTHYQTLGVPDTATTEEIKAAHRRLARALHPDINRAPDAEEKFKGLQLAYEILSSKQARKDYDYSLLLDERVMEKIDEAQNAYGISVYTPRKKEKKPSQKKQKHRKANVDFEEIPEGFINDGMGRSDAIGGIL